jgi:hypothetical protein
MKQVIKEKVAQLAATNQFLIYWHGGINAGCFFPNGKFFQQGFIKFNEMRLYMLIIPIGQTI